ncbi:hypothetical protein SAMN05444487_103185 [Marininema mesophilum]|uniref:Uncharacterized protein n=1 Tax=Marininema mesophilum TaxID=1048340 RepID=A0A1H2TMC0_9BACL|nr:hypothetical protein [Marininema mesophilum]SDW45113.1 hypothetical protein SAMN05444487_103185 [Marininema mesophilum]
MAERTIFAFFRTEQRAIEAVHKLKEHGFDEVTLSRFNPDLTAEIGSLAFTVADPLIGPSLQMGSTTDSSYDANILRSTDTKANGMSDGCAEWGAEDLSLTVIVDETRAEEAEQLLEGMGGRL